MVLHRDIYWVGRQWAVTGHGLQAVDQRLKGHFDIEASRLWEDGLLERLQAEKWLNSEDFAKALAQARTRYPEPSRQAAPPQPPVARPEPGGPVQRSKPASPEFVIRVRGWPAKFVRPWRVSIRR
jgi:hypothetical protein